MDWRDHIVTVAGTCGGKPHIKGTRVTVELILGYLALGWSEARIADAYPQLSTDQIRAALAFASTHIGDKDQRAGGRAVA